MTDIELNLLEKNQVFGENKLKVFEKIGNQVEPTEYAMVCGACFVHNEESATSVKGSYFLKYIEAPEQNKSTWVSTISFYGDAISSLFSWRDSCIRPVVLFSQIKDICSDITIGPNGENIVECGVLPENILSETKEIELKNKLAKGLLEQVDLFDPNSSTNLECFSELYGPEPKYYKDIQNNKLYASVKCNPDKYTGYLWRDIIQPEHISKIFKRRGNDILMECTNVQWIVNDDLDIAFARKGIVAGVPYNHNDVFIDYKESNVYKYMNTYLVRVMFNQYQKNSGTKEQLKVLEKKKDS